MHEARKCVLSLDELSRAENKWWGDEHWLPGSNFMLPSPSDSGQFIRDVLRDPRKLKIGSETIDKFYERNFHTEMPESFTKAEADQFIKACLQKLRLNEELPIGSNPFYAFSQEATNLVANCTEATIHDVKTAITDCVSASAKWKKSVAFESRREEGQNKTILKMKVEAKGIEIYIKGSLEDKLYSIALKATIEYEMEFIPNKDPEKVGSYKLRDPVKIYGPDGLMVQLLMLADRLLPEDLDKLVSRYNNTASAKPASSPAIAAPLSGSISPTEKRPGGIEGVQSKIKDRVGKNARQVALKGVGAVGPHSAAAILPPKPAAASARQKPKPAAEASASKSAAPSRTASPFHTVMAYTKRYGGTPKDEPKSGSTPK